MRPELVAFRELEVLVRNLSEQLAQFRRRALSAEGRSRELELMLERARREMTAQRERFEAESAAARKAATEAAAAAAAAAALKANQEAAAHAAATTAATATTEPATDPAAFNQLKAENEELRQRLGEAGLKAEQMVERVKFLRHQMGAGQ